MTESAHSRGSTRIDVPLLVPEVCLGRDFEEADRKPESETTDSSPHLKNSQELIAIQRFGRVKVCILQFWGHQLA